jgi:hypothetical protein
MSGEAPDSFSLLMVAFCDANSAMLQQQSNQKIVDHANSRFLVEPCRRKMGRRRRDGCTDGTSWPQSTLRSRRCPDESRRCASFASLPIARFQFPCSRRTAVAAVRHRSKFVVRRTRIVHVRHHPPAMQVHARGSFLEVR